MKMICGKVVKVVSIPPDRIVLHVREESGQKSRIEILGFKPHFYVPDRNGNFRSLFGKRLKKIEVSDFRLVPQERVKYDEHYQADVPYTRNFLICSGVRSGVLLPARERVFFHEIQPVDTDVETRRCFIDIETYGEGSLDVLSAPAPVVSFSTWNNCTKRIITMTVGKGKNTENKHFFETERELLIAIRNYLLTLDPDIIICWSADYDIPYLKARGAKFGIDFQFQRFEIFDLKKADIKLHRRFSHSLKDVAVEEGFATEIVNYDEAAARYEQGDAEFMAEYNAKDVEYMVMLDQKYRIVDFFERIKNYAGVAHYSDALKFSVLVDTMLLRIAREMNVILPSSKERDEEDEETKYVGGLVTFFADIPRKGVFKNVAAIDFSAYYPSLIYYLNISPEVPTGSDKRGIIPELIWRLRKEREKIERELDRYQPGTPEYENIKQKRDVVKYLTNAVYGYTGAPFTRLYSVEKAETVTTTGRETLQHIAQYVRKLGFEPLYGDTDSIMIQVPSLARAQELVEELNREIKRFFKERFSKDVEIKMDLNWYGDVLFLGVKKKYAAHITWQRKPCDYFRFAGLEVIRTDQSRFTQDVQRALIELVLLARDKEQIISFCKKVLEDFRKQPPERIAFRKGISKPLESYGKDGAGIPAHIRGALYSNQVFKTHFGAGSKPLYLYIKKIIGKPPTDIVAFDHRAPPNIVIDWERMEDLTLRRKIENILDAVGIRWDELKSLKTVQKSLIDFSPVKKSASKSGR